MCVCVCVCVCRRQRRLDTLSWSYRQWLQLWSPQANQRQRHRPELRDCLLRDRVPSNVRLLSLSLILSLSLSLSLSFSLDNST